IVEAVLEVEQCAPGEVVDADDLDALFEQTVAEMRPDEPGGAGNAYPLHVDLLTRISRVRCVAASAVNVAAVTYLLRIYAASTRSNDAPKVVWPYSGNDRLSRTIRFTFAAARRAIARRSSAGF